MDSEAEQILRGCVTRARRSFSVATIGAVVVLAAPWVAMALGKLSALQAAQTTALVGLLVLIVVGSTMVVSQRTAAVESALLQRPQDVVWAYISTGNGGALVLGLSNGKRLTLITDIRRTERLLEAVRETAPWATLGFDPAHDRAFRSSPESLRRAA